MNDTETTPPSTPPVGGTSTRAASSVVARWTPRIFLRRHWAIFLPAFVYLYIFPYLPALRSPNELCRLLQSRALVDHHSPEIGEELRIHGQVGDLSCVALARSANGRVTERLPCPQAQGLPRFKEKRYFPSKAPLLAFAAAPIYGLLKFVRGDVPELALMFFARVACVILPSILLLVLIRRYLATIVSNSLADLVTLAYALGTLAFSYSEQFVSHQGTAVLAFACFFVLWRLRRGEWPMPGYALAGFLAGLTVAAEYTGALALLLPLGAYGVLTAPWRRPTGSSVGPLSFAGLGLVPARPGTRQPTTKRPSRSPAGHRLPLPQRCSATRAGTKAASWACKLAQGARAFLQSFFSPSAGAFHPVAGAACWPCRAYSNPRFAARSQTPSCGSALATLFALHLLHQQLRLRIVGMDHGAAPSDARSFPSCFCRSPYFFAHSREPRGQVVTAPVRGGRLSQAARLPV
jgi:hypothetical protein